MTLNRGLCIQFTADTHLAQQAMDRAYKRVQEMIDRIMCEIRQNGPEVGSD